jgi:hypothetical protein
LPVGVLTNSLKYPDGVVDVPCILHLKYVVLLARAVFIHIKPGLWASKSLMIALSIATPLISVSSIIKVVTEPTVALSNLK